MTDDERADDPVHDTEHEPPANDERPIIDGAMDDAPSARKPHRKDPLHGITLERMLTELVDHFGWETMGQRIKVRCFTTDPSIASSLRLLRKTPWAREKVEGMYLYMQRAKARDARAAGPADDGGGG